MGYGFVVSCAIPIELGGLWWTWPEDLDYWPPEMREAWGPFGMFEEGSSPHEVPGILTLIDTDTAVFRADVDGSEFTLQARERNPSPGEACL